MIVLLILTDGRLEYLERTIASARENLRGPISRTVIHDDSGITAYGDHLRSAFPDFEVYSTGRRSGFGGAIRSAWSYLARTAEADEARFVFHLEDDFTFNRPVPLAELAFVLDHRPELVQLALRRQPWNETERAAGGIVESNPAAYEERRTGPMFRPMFQWLEHRLFFTTNPSLYRRSLTWRGWPEGAHSEGRFGIELLNENPDAVFGFWGARDSGEWVTHIGDVRAGTGY